MRRNRGGRQHRASAEISGERDGLTGERAEQGDVIVHGRQVSNDRGAQPQKVWMRASGDTSGQMADVNATSAAWSIDVAGTSA